MLVVAGAGTGKTRVITERIRLLLVKRSGASRRKHRRHSPSSSLAEEMKWRIKKHVGERADAVTLGTFHSFCNAILLEADPELRALDNFDHWILLRRNIRQLELNLFRRLAEPGEFLNDFVAFFSRCQDELVSPADYDRDVAAMRAEMKARRGQMEPDAQKIQDEMLAREEELARAYRVSEGLLRERKMVTFGAMLMQAVQMLRSNAALLERLRARYRYILVDEFQDTIAQLELLQLLMNERRNLFVVGDHNQAIYRFRGASFASLKQFLTRFCGVSVDSPESSWPRVHLTQNYRSTKRILRVAGTVAAESDNSRFIPFTPLVTQNSEGDKIRIAEFGRPEEEAEWVASEIDRLHAAGTEWREFAALYRKHAHRKHLVEALNRRQIPFVIKRLSILGSTLIRDVMAYLRLIGTPSDDVSCARIIGIPYWKIEPKDLVRLAERAAKSKGKSLWDELESWCKEPAGAGPPKGSRARELTTFIVEMRGRARKLTAFELLTELIAEIGVAPVAAEMDSYNLARLKDFVEEWQKKEGRSLHDFLGYLNFFEEANGDIFLQKEPVHDAVQLMTVHSAKGLEFPHVFILQSAREISRRECAGRFLNFRRGY